MPSPSDPTRAWRRRQRTTLAIGGCAVLASLAWALAPLSPVPDLDVELRSPARGESGEDALPPVDRGAFAARLWNPLPPPATPETTSEPRQAAAPPPRLQLIGIVHDTAHDGEQILRAALYDPDTDTLHIVASGEQIVGVLIAAVDPESVRLEVGGRPATLALRDEPDSGRRP